MLFFCESYKVNLYTATYGILEIQTIWNQQRWNYHIIAISVYSNKLDFTKHIFISLFNHSLIYLEFSNLLKKVK